VSMSVEMFFVRSFGSTADAGSSGMSIWLICVIFKGVRDLFWMTGQYDSDVPVDVQHTSGDSIYVDQGMVEAVLVDGSSTG
jgi:hypothetical protein